MRRIVYCSRAVSPFDEAQLIELLDSARAFNADRDVTGMLVYSHGGFMQAVEGPAESVDAVWRRIRGDGRHADLRLLSDEDVQIRRFPDWSMSFVHAHAEGLPAEHPGFNHEPEFMLVDPGSVSSSGVAVAVLSLYARNRIGTPHGPGAPAEPPAAAIEPAGATDPEAATDRAAATDPAPTPDPAPLRRVDPPARTRGDVPRGTAPIRSRLS